MHLQKALNSSMPLIFMVIKIIAVMMSQTVVAVHVQNDEDDLSGMVTQANRTKLLMAREKKIR